MSIPLEGEVLGPKVVRERMLDIRDTGDEEASHANRFQQLILREIERAGASIVDTVSRNREMFGDVLIVRVEIRKG